MAKSFSGDVGAFLPTTSIFDPGLVRSLNVNSEEFKEVLVQLMQAVNNIALVTNIKDTGYYYQQQFVNGQVYFPNPAFNSTTAQSPVGRQVTRMVINFGPLPNAAEKSVAHGVTFNSSISGTRVYGCATNPGVRLVSIANNDINVQVTPTDIVLTTESDYSDCTICYMVLEYLTS